MSFHSPFLDGSAKSLVFQIFLSSHPQGQVTAQLPAPPRTSVAPAANSAFWCSPDPASLAQTPPGFLTSRCPGCTAQCPQSGHSFIFTSTSQYPPSWPQASVHHWLPCFEYTAHLFASVTVAVSPPCHHHHLPGSKSQPHSRTRQKPSGGNTPELLTPSLPLTCIYYAHLQWKRNPSSGWGYHFP